jgi:GDP-L-fucose synthase
MPTLIDKRIVVTGGAGFVGSAVCEQLTQSGAAEVVVPRSRDYDLTSAEATRQLFADATPNVVIHLAAEAGGITAHRANPGRFFYANLAMGLHLIEQARVSGIEKFVLIGSAASYPKFAPVPTREEDLWEGYPEDSEAPYGVAKRSLLVMLQAYRKQYGLNGINLIPVNIYGPGDNFDLTTAHVIPALVRRFIEARDKGTGPVVAWGSGSASREFLYVDDAARGIVLAAERYNGELPVNLGTSRETTIRQLVELIAELTGYHGEIRWDTTKPDGQPRRKMDTSKANQFFDFEAHTSLEDGLRITIDWWERQAAR